MHSLFDVDTNTRPLPTSPLPLPTPDIGISRHSEQSSPQKPAFPSLFLVSICYHHGGAEREVYHVAKDAS